MAVRIVRLGSPRHHNEGLRLGTVRRPPRGVPKSEFASRDFYDVWLPNLSPSQGLVTEALHAKNEKEIAAFKRKFRAELKECGAERILDLLAALSHTTSFSLGCYCEDEHRCHRSVLREVLAERGADFKETL
jgi:uncharacterized protein YeaO (DUF488 family)